MAARLAEHEESGPEVLIHAIHGAMLLWSDQRDNAEWEPKRFLTPETIYRPANFEKYLEAYEDPDPTGSEVSPEQAAKQIAELERSRDEF
jgi:hypothetical protein